MINNMNELMKKAQKMQQELMKSQAELEKKEYQGSAGGDMVKVVVSGSMQVKSVKLDPEVVSKDDVEMLEDLLTAAVNQALAKAKEDSSSGIKGLTKGMNIPGLNL